MERHFVLELERLKTNIVKMGSLAEQAIADSIRAVLERDADLAHLVLAQETQINSLEIEIDQAVVDLLALRQPVASDLRFILAGMKINNDLERIGDHAVNVAESAIKSARLPHLSVLHDIPRMGVVAQGMLREAIDGFIHTNPELARKVLRDDDIIDDLNRKTVNDLVQIIQHDPTSVEQALELVRVSRNLERVADLATNIAEEVIFMAEAQIVKHNIAGTSRA